MNLLSVRQVGRLRISAFALMLICRFCVLPLAHGELIASISVEKISNGDAPFRYSYRIENSASSTETINAFVLDVGTDADLQSLEWPSGWVGNYDPQEDPFELGFVSTAPQFDIPIGGAGEFSFTSPLDAALLQYYIANLAPDGSDLGSVVGYAAAPAFVPLPGDFNGDGVVDSADLTDPANGWETRFGVNLDGRDLLQWQRQFGNAAASAPSVRAPEPTAAASALAAVAALCGINRRRLAIQHWKPRYMAS